MRLLEINPTRESLSLKIDSEPTVGYSTQFIGTRLRFNQASEPIQATNGPPVTRNYSAEIGQVFAEVTGVNPSYQFKGDELYVRAKVYSSKPKTNGYAADEVEVAWTQPIVPKREPIRD